MYRNEPAAPARSTFRIACTCGAVATGERRETHQVVTCTRCGSDIFVLPTSPWHAPRAHDAQAIRPLRYRDWLWPLAGAVLAVAALVLLYALLFAPDGSHASSRPPSRAELLARQADAEALLGKGSFRLALAELNPGGAAPELSALSDPERRRWMQVQRQAELMGDIATESIEEIIRHAGGVNEAEWLADFEQRYRGKAFVFEGDVRRNPAGKWEIRIPIGMPKARLVVDDVRMLQRVPGQGPERVLLGVRLASVRLEAPGPAWVVRFQPDSGVLLTSPCWPYSSLLDADEVRKRMAGWLEE